MTDVALWLLAALIVVPTTIAFIGWVLKIFLAEGRWAYTTATIIVFAALLTLQGFRNAQEQEAQKEANIAHLSGCLQSVSDRASELEKSGSDKDSLFNQTQLAMQLCREKYPTE